MSEHGFRIGISGGTFDPIHTGHLVMAEHIRQSMLLDRIIFIPSGNPPHKRFNDVTESCHRLGMIKAGILDNPYFEVSEAEINRGGYTYTVDTLTQLKNEYDSRCNFVYIVGADVIFDLLTWKDFQKVFTLCEFSAVMRPGFDREAFFSTVEDLKKRHGAIIHITEAPLIDISSTGIRERVRQGRSIKYLVPQAVEEYIYANGLYV